MLANNEVEKDVPPSRCLMWYKARQNKDGEIEDEEVKTLAQQLQSPSHSSGSQKNQTAYSVGQNDDTVTDHILQLKQSTKESSKTVKNNVESSPVQVNTPSPKGERTIKCRLAIVSKRHVVASGRIYLSEGLQTCHNVPVQEDCYKVSIDRSIQDAAFLPHEIPDARTVGDAVGSFVPWPKDLCIIDDDQQTENQKVDDFTNGTTTKHVDGQQRNQPKDSKVKKTPKTKGQVQYVQLKNIKSKLTRSSNNAAAKPT